MRRAWVIAIAAFGCSTFSQTIIIWDPSTMMITGTIDLSAAPSRGYAVDGETWIAESDERFSGTTLINISGNDFRRGIFVPTSILNVFRLR